MREQTSSFGHHRVSETLSRRPYTSRSRLTCKCGLHRRLRLESNGQQGDGEGSFVMNRPRVCGEGGQHCANGRTCAGAMGWLAVRRFFCILSLVVLAFIPSAEGFIMAGRGVGAMQKGGGGGILGGVALKQTRGTFSFSALPISSTICIGFTMHLHALCLVSHSNFFFHFFLLQFFFFNFFTTLFLFFFQSFSSIIPSISISIRMGVKLVTQFARNPG